jgi:hypothetical protein
LLQASVFAKDVHFENCLSMIVGSSESFDFPVVLQARSHAGDAAAASQGNFFSINVVLEPTVDTEASSLAWKQVTVELKPVSVYVEDIMWRKLGLLLDNLLR